MSFVARYLSLTNNVMVKTRLPPKLKKCNIFVILLRKCPILTNFYKSQRIRNPFLALALRNFTVRELAYDNLFIFYWRIYRRVRDFILKVRKISHRTGTCQWQVFRPWMTRRILCVLNFKMKMKILKFKILQWMHRKFAAIQQNREKSILFHETIPLNIDFRMLILSILNNYCV
jgi:hypothetical protein